MAVASGPVGPVLAGPIFSPCSHTHLSCCVEHARLGSRICSCYVLLLARYSLAEHIHGVACGPVGPVFSGPNVHLVATHTLVVVCVESMHANLFQC